MAKISFDGFENYRAILKQIEGSEDYIIKPAVYDGAAIVVEEVKKSLRNVVGPDSTGDLERSMGLTKMQDDFGFIHTKLGFDGYDRNGHPNIVKARALESGTSKQPKRPFIRPAVKRVQDRAIKQMDETVNRQIKNILNERGK